MNILGGDILEPCKYLVPHQTFSLCVYLYLYGFLCYSKGYNSLFSFIFMLNLAPVWPVEAPRSWLLCTFAMSPTFFEHSLVYWHNKMFQVHHVFSLPHLWNQPFAQGSIIPFGRKWCLEVKIWAQDVITAIPRLSVDWAREYIYLSIYYLSKSILKTELILICPIPIQHYSVHSSFFFLFCIHNSLLQQ